MTEETLTRFLDWLDADREQAARKYEALRGRLVEYFSKRQCAAAEDLADDVLNAAMNHLSKQTALFLDNPLPYIFGIARNVYRHYINRQLLTSGEAGTRLPVDRRQAEEAKEKETLSHCLRHCLQQLAEGERQTLLLYYLKAKNQKGKHTEEMAAHLGCTINALRLKMMRLRERLRDCITLCRQGISH